VAYTIPGKQTVRELTRTHERTFCLEKNALGELHLNLKLIPTQSLSVINGVPTTLYVSSPARKPVSVTFVLDDIEHGPAWVTRDYSDGNTRKLIPEICAATTIRVVLYDWDMKCIHTEAVCLTVPAKPIADWFASGHPESGAGDLPYATHYPIVIGAIQKAPTLRYKNTSFGSLIGKEKPYVISSNRHTEWLDVQDFLKDGRHGFYQEHTLTTQLLRVFTPDRELFLSPTLRDKTELTDFLISYDATLVLIESKASRPYQKLPRTVASTESSMTELLSKAFRQLGRARKFIGEGSPLIAHPALAAVCASHKTLVTLCVIDDALMINREDAEFRLSTEGEKQHSYILEIEDFLGVLLRSGSKKSIINILNRYRLNIPASPRLPLFHIRF
jgi:hypothetical protein